VVTFDTLSYVSIFLIGMALPFCGGGFAVEIVRDRESKAGPTSPSWPRCGDGPDLMRGGWAP